MLVPKPRKDRTGAFYGCPDYPDCKQQKTVSLTLTHIQQVESLLAQQCIKCGSVLTPELIGSPVRAILTCNPACGEMQKVDFTR